MNTVPTEIPADVMANVRGLTPHRAALVRYQAWRKREERALADAKRSRDALAIQVKECETTIATVEETITAQSGGIVDAIKRGAAWSLRSLSGKSGTELESRRSTASHHAQVGRKALKTLDDEIAKLEAGVDAIAVQQEAYVNAALIEHAKAEYIPRYEKAISDLYEAITALEAIDSRLGGGHGSRIVVELPGFRGMGHMAEVHPLVILPSAMRKAAAVWQNLANAWTINPKADPSKKLRFDPRNPNEEDMTPYEQRSDAERHLIDIQRSRQGNLA